MTVILATRNRAALLGEALEGLVRQQTGGQFTYDILVVDNGSTDATAAAVRRAAEGAAVAVDYLYEPQPGKQHALNAAISRARGDILAFTDDDIILSVDWLAQLWRCFEETHTDVIAGRILPRWIDIEPGWDTEQIQAHIGTIGCLDFGEARLVLSDHPTRYWMVGGNFALRRELLERYGGFDPRLGSGEDVELFRRLARHGVSVVYDPAAVLQHRVPKERVTPAALRRFYENRGWYRAYTSPWRAYQAVTVMPISWYANLVKLCWRWTTTIFNRRRAWEHLACECQLRANRVDFLHRLQLLPAWWWMLARGRARDTFPSVTVPAARSRQA